MYARVITSQLQPGKTDDAIKIWREKVSPALKQIKGFKGAYLCGDRNSGKGVTVTLWESEADANAMDASGKYQEMISLFSALFAGTPTREQYEVLLQV